MTGITNSELNAENGDAPESVIDIIARGAEQAAATVTEPAPEAVAAAEGITLTEPRRRRKGRPRKAPEPTEEELQAQAQAAELDAFFSEQGIGTVFTNGLNAFYLSCGAVQLTPEEQPMMARVFAQWARFRLPSGASSYQPDILLCACLMMTTLPRMQPIANTTAPFWRRFFTRLFAPFRRAHVKLVP